MNVEVTTLEHAFDYLFDIGAEKFLFEKEKRYLYDLLEKLDLEHLPLNEDFDYYLDNDGLEDIIRDEGM